MKRLAVVGLAMAAPVVALADATGTNAVTLLSDNANNAITTFWPITIGLITLFLAVKLGKRFLRKAA